MQRLFPNCSGGKFISHTQINVEIMGSPSVWKLWCEELMGNRKGQTGVWIMISFFFNPFSWFIGPCGGHVGFCLLGRLKCGIMTTIIEKAKSRFQQSNLRKRLEFQLHDMNIGRWQGKRDRPLNSSLGGHACLSRQSIAFTRITKSINWRLWTWLNLASVESNSVNNNASVFTLGQMRWGGSCKRSEWLGLGLRPVDLLMGPESTRKRIQSS